jgi:hypothetical protein
MSRDLFASGAFPAGVSFSEWPKEFDVMAVSKIHFNPKPSGRPVRRECKDGTSWQIWLSEQKDLAGKPRRLFLP